MTVAIANKQFNKATNVKVAIEEVQREKVKARDANGEQWNPSFFQRLVVCFRCFSVTDGACQGRYCVYSASEPCMRTHPTRSENGS